VTLDTGALIGLERRKVRAIHFLERWRGSSSSGSGTTLARRAE
jgi:hypothetical protein